MHLQALQAYLIKNLCTCFKLFLKFEQPGPPVGSLKGGAKLLLEVGQLCTNLNKSSFSPRAAILAFSAVNCWSKTIETLRASSVPGKRAAARASSQ